MNTEISIYIVQFKRKILANKNFKNNVYILNFRTFLLLKFIMLKTYFLHLKIHDVKIKDFIYIKTTYFNSKVILFPQVKDLNILILSKFKLKWVQKLFV